MPKILAHLQQANPLATSDQAFDWLEKNRPGMNLWFTSGKGPNKPAGAELWLVHVLACLGLIASGTVIGLGRWGRRKAAEAAALAAKSQSVARTA